ncbi:hypothetical protein EVJ58_g8453 [Rhodofomes roseus]|uniref:DUF6589 domain-containing protein n=1 Tax=Rhodofomes roseus TaxID=34475 RepID=A0A4Y9XY78_9APHY|nr:hypothetical protein EVJ58_g8453 [Rhodofomes roseus]
MGRKPPSNLSKVDYNEGMETLFTVLDARILDCFRLHWDTPDLFTYFAKRAEEKTLPSLATSSRSSGELQQAVQSAAGEESALSEPYEFQGDRALAQSIAPMRDAVVLREFVLATCEGDVGRMRL